VYRIHFPSIDATLLLSPRWGELHGTAQVLLILVFLAPPLLVLSLYRYELRLVHRGVAMLLLSLRLSALGFLLLLVGLQPVIERSRTEELPGRVIVAVDRSASMEVQDEKDGATRAEQARKLLANDAGGLLQALEARHRVELVGFARDSWELPRSALGQPEKPGPANAVTDLRSPLNRALERSGTDAGKLVGIVLLTDGRHNWGATPVARAGELKERGMPIYPIPFGARQAPPDIVAVALKAPPSVFKDVEITVEAQVKVTGFQAQLIRLELHQEKRRPAQESAWETLGVENLRHDGTDRTYTVPFSVRLSDVGTQLLRVTARPADERALSQPLRNNRQLVQINVADDQARVLLIDGEARWEFCYLASALGRDRSLKLDRVLFEQPILGRLGEAELKKLGHPARSLPVEPEALAGYDCIILGDVAPERLPPADRLRLEKFVADRGGTLVLLAGKRWLPLAYADAAPTAGETDPLLKLLPILRPHVVQTTATRGLAMQLTPDGQLAAYLQMDPNAELSLKTWAELPGHFWGVAGQAKPGAVALASLSDPESAHAKSGGGEIDTVIARQNYGLGRVIYIGVDSTWRWRFRIGDGYHHRFWGQLVRWAATDKPLVVGNEHVRFGTAQPVYSQGQEVDVTVRLGEGVSLPPANGSGGTRVIRIGDEQKEEALALAPLQRVEARPRILEGRLRELPPGDYRIELVIPGLEDKLIDPRSPSGKLRASFRVTPPASTELTELTVNLPLLEDLAARSGGRVYQPEGAAALAELLQRQVVTRTVPTERKLWQEWGALAVFLLLLTAEWVSRKLAGLP
jgi:hypothetical protein